MMSSYEMSFFSKGKTYEMSISDLVDFTYLCETHIYYLEPNPSG